MVSSTRMTERRAAHRCSYLSCPNNIQVVGTTLRGGNILRRCPRCNLSRYCSKECQAADWADHRIWCNTHRAHEDAPDEDWRKLHSRLPRWCLHHRPALKLALCSALQIPDDSRAHEASGIHLFVAFYPDNPVKISFRIEKIRRIQLEGCEGNIRDDFAQARRREEERYRQREPKTCHGTGLVLLSIRHSDASNYETTLPLYLELTRLDAVQPGCEYWAELLAAHLHFGHLLDPAANRQCIDRLITTHEQNPSVGTRSAENWDHDWYPLPLSEETESRLLASVPTYTLETVSHNIYEEFFAYAPIQQKAIVAQVADLFKDVIRYCEENRDTLHESVAWDMMDRACRLLLTVLRFSKPTRIVEAIPYLHILMQLDNMRPWKDVPTDYRLQLCLAAALANSPGHEDEALLAYNTGTGVRDASQAPFGSLDIWVLANMSRMLRRAGKVKEAEKAENEVADELRRHGQFTSVAHRLVRDDLDPGSRNHILAHPWVTDTYRNITELPCFLPASGGVAIRKTGDKHIFLVAKDDIRADYLKKGGELVRHGC